VTDRQLKARLQAHFRLDEARAEALMAAYRKDGASRSAADILAYLSSDVLARGPLVQAAEAKAKAGAAPVYLYHFDWKIPVDGGVWRSPHAVDIPFAFGTVDQARAMTGDGPGPMEVSRNLMSAFVAFARSGKPDNARMPPWRPYDAVSRPTMVVDESCRLVNDYHANDRIASGPLLGEDPSTFLRGALFRYSE
ncbi:MAG TPA: carboxylesterase family protein, partial [Ramlibacter sp.]|nr:carboxylesterase family protein [Ramlibacter sp.]